MKISMYTTYALELDPGKPVENLRYFRERGVEYADMLDIEPLLPPLHLYCRYLRDAGIQPGSFVSTEPIASGTPLEQETAIARVKGVIDQLEKLGIPLLMLAPRVRAAASEAELLSMRQQLIEGFGAVLDYAKGSGVRICMENQSSITRADSTIEDVAFLLDALPDLGYVLDAGNFFCAGEDVLKACDRFACRMVHAHLKDWCWDPYGPVVRENKPRFRGCALGDGILPLKELIARLKQLGYRGNLMIEINSAGPQVTREMLDRSAAFLHEQLK